MKTREPKTRLNRQILDEASAWFVEFRSGDIDVLAGRGRFDQWLRQSPEHIRAYIEIAKTYVALPAFAAERKLDVAELIAYARSDGNVIPFNQLARPDEPPTARDSGPQRAEALRGLSIPARADRQKGARRLGADRLCRLPPELGRAAPLSGLLDRDRGAAFHHPGGRLDHRAERSIEGGHQVFQSQSRRRVD